MTNNKQRVWLALVALVFVQITAGYVPAKNDHRASQPQDAVASQVQAVPNGQEMKITGFVLKRYADSFILRDKDGVVREVALRPKTEVKTQQKGVFRGGKEYGVSYILRGLRLEVSGEGNAQGQLVAEKIKFEEDDLRTAQALQATIDPLEAQSEADRQRIAAAEEEARRLARESEENAAAAARAQAASSEAVDTAAEALRLATIANNRINGLDDYDPVRTITVAFAVGSSVLGPQGKATIDTAAAWVKTQNTKGWVVAVVGFADTTGQTEANRKLSERRANAVIGYLVSKHNLPLQRLVQPFGYGEHNPVAENTTAAGRALNRRVEIRLLVNKGIANTTQ
jgi:outer membrane protein OmpA-like peptidoglycan-associated protein